MVESLSSPLWLSTIDEAVGYYYQSREAVSLNVCVCVFLASSLDVATLSKKHDDDGKSLAKTRSTVSQLIKREAAAAASASA